MTTPGLVITDRSEVAIAPTVGDTVIAIVGTAPEATDVTVNTPVQVESQADHSTRWGSLGRIPNALAAIKSNVSDTVVVVRVPDAGSETQYNAGLDALLAVEASLGIVPTIIVPLDHTYAISVSGTSAVFGSSDDPNFEGVAATGSEPSVVVSGYYWNSTDDEWQIANEAGDAWIGIPDGSTIDDYLANGFAWLSDTEYATSADATTAATEAGFVPSDKYVYYDGTVMQVLTLVVTESDAAASVVAKAGSVAASFDGVAMVDVFPDAGSDPDAFVASAGNWADANRQGDVIGLTPRVRVGNVYEPLAPYVAGALARHDAEQSLGVAANPQGLDVRGISELERNLSWTLASTSLQVDRLVQKSIVTLVRHAGYHVWGATMLVDPTSMDPERFINVRRQSHDIARHIEETSFSYFSGMADSATIERVMTEVTGYLNHLIALEKIRSGSCTAPPELNTEAAKASGLVYFRTEYNPRFPLVGVRFDKVIRV